MSIGLLPGTTIETDLSKPDAAERMFSPMFMAGGLVLSQVSQLTGLEPHVIQNWVKRGFVSSPVAKKYSRRQFCRIVIINFLKDSFQLDRIVKMLQYINGSLSNEEDDLVDDYTLYGYFVKAVKAARPPSRALTHYAKLLQKRRWHILTIIPLQKDVWEKCYRLCWLLMLPQG